MTKHEAQARWVCCPMCDRDKCCFGASDCDAKKWMDERGELDNNSTKVDNENGELSCSEEPNRSDTIYRQKAIDVLRAMQTYKLGAGDDILLIDQAEAQAELLMLPPAQPEPIKLQFDHVLTEEEIKNLKQKIADSPIVTIPSEQPDVTAINKFIDGLEEIFADIRERQIDDSVCGLCEFDGAYVGESGDWCNECPGFNRDDCFKLSDRIREKWIAEITNTRTISGGRTG